MVIAGLWHGPQWTFVAWGLSHGAALAVNQVWKRRGLRMPDGVGWLLTTIFVTSTIVFLRAENLREALHMLTRLTPHENPFGMSALRNHLAFDADADRATGDLRRARRLSVQELHAVL